MPCHTDRVVDPQELLLSAAQISAVASSAVIGVMFIRHGSTILGMLFMLFALGFAALVLAVRLATRNRNRQ